jgi:carbon-monoxide dehydrogenase small subunit
MEPDEIHLTVNGTARAVSCEPGTPLLDVLRSGLALAGPRFGCGAGLCGACFVLIDGRPRSSCDLPAPAAAGTEITTVEGLASEGKLHPVQQAFLDAGAVQCGFCTPGLVVTAHDLLSRVQRPTDHEIREALAGNLCRCTGYEKILNAVRLAAQRLAGAADKA